MNRRLTVAVAATAALGLTAGGVASAGAAAKKNEIRIVGGTKFKAGKYLKDDVRFTPANVTVRSGATVTLRNKGTDPAPHTITFVAKRYLPKSFDVAVEDQLLAAHQVDPTAGEDAPPGVTVVDNGVAVPEGGMLQADTGFTPTTAGDSAFIFPGQKTFQFKVTAESGSRLFYFCAIHPWMQGKIKVK